MTVEVPCRVGDKIGYIQEFSRDGKTEWKLMEGRVTSIRMNKNDIVVRVPKLFTRPLDADSLGFNTEDMEKAEGYILVREPFVLNDITKPKAERWVTWANENPEQVKSILESIN